MSDEIIIKNKKTEVIGIYCEEKGNIAFDECILCAKCMPKHMIQGLIKKFLHNDIDYPPTDRYTFRTSQICSGNPKTNGFGCMREAVLDHFYSTDGYVDLASMYKMERGTQLHELFLNQFSWQELRIFHKGESDEGIKWIINGRLDGYDEENYTIYDVKTTEFVPFFRQYPNGWIKHQKQVQAYYSMLSATGKKVDKIELDYVDMSVKQGNSIRDYIKRREVPVVNILPDMEDWVNEVLHHIYMCTINKKLNSLPEKITGVKCTYCAHTVRCKGLLKKGV